MQELHAAARRRSPATAAPVARALVQAAAAAASQPSRRVAGFPGRHFLCLMGCPSRLASSSLPAFERTPASNQPTNATTPLNPLCNNPSAFAAAAAGAAQRATRVKGIPLPLLLLMMMNETGCVPAATASNKAWAGLGALRAVRRWQNARFTCLQPCVCVGCRVQSNAGASIINH